MIDSVASKHYGCQMAIRWKLFKGKTSPTPGLFCSCHDTFLDWLPDDIAYDLIDNHHVPVETYIERKKKPKPSLSKVKDNSKYLKTRQKKKKKIKKAQTDYKLKYGSEMPK